VRFWVDSTYFSFDTTAPYSKQWDTTSFSNGSHVIRVQAVDNSGATNDDTVTVTVANTDVTPPAVSITSPGSGASVDGAVTIAAAASDTGGMQKVRFWVDGTYLAFDTTAPYTRSWDTTSFTNGPHTVRAQAVDNAGNSTDTTVSVNVNNADAIPPSVSVTWPSDGATVAGTVTIAAFASDAGGVQKVRFWVDTTYLSFDTTSPYSKVWDTSSFAPGPHTIRAQAVDYAGNTADATITVNLAAP
jgi:hypothetical protein